MDRFDRQRRIANWNQQPIQDSRVVVCGRDWLGTFAVWGLASLGVGEILWVGAPRAATDPMARWFLAHPSPFSGCAIYDYPFDVEYGPELAWVEGGSSIQHLVACTEDLAADRWCWQYARDRRIPVLSASTADGGWMGPGVAPAAVAGDEDPVVSMVAAALIVDSIREALAPLGGRAGSVPHGALSMIIPPPRRPGSFSVVGVGGIGVYAATLAAAVGVPMRLVDDDRVEASNLNRQGLFAPADVGRRARKAEAAGEALRRFFPAASIDTRVARVSEATAASFWEGDDVILSAVDNAQSRLVLQSAGRAAGLPVVQCGTDVFAADCYTQELGGPLINEQMHGAMSAAMANEASRRRGRAGGCAGDPSYVVPGMLAGALMVYRALQARELYRGLRPIHWRSGDLPVEERSPIDGFELDEIAL